MQIVFIVMMVLTALFDMKYLRVSIWSLISLTALILVKGHIDFVSLGLGFALMAASVYISDFVLKRETLGGGDLWLGSLMACFLGIDRFLDAYLVAAGLGSIYWVMIQRKYWILDVPFVPFMAMGALVAVI